MNSIFPRKGLLLLACIVFSNLLLAQKTTVRGTVTDQETQEPIPYANIRLTNLQDTTEVLGGISDMQGWYRIDRLATGYYRLEVSFLGYAKHIISRITIGEDEVEIPNIALRRATNALEEVVVIAEKSYVESDMTGYTLNVGQDVVNQGGNAIDVIKKLPSVSVDFDNNIKMRGSNVTVMIDDTKVELQDVLEQLPAGAIESVKLVTNPNAKYDSKNAGAVLEINLRKGKKRGLNGRFQIGAGTSNSYVLSAGGNLRTSTNNLRVNFSVKNKERLSEGEMERTALVDTKKDNFTRNKRFSKDPGGNLRISNTFYLPQKQHITLGFQAIKYQSESEQKNSSTYFTEEKTIENYNTRENQNATSSLITKYHAQYRRKYKNKNRKLRAKIEYKRTLRAYFSDNNTVYFNAENEPTSEPRLIQINKANHLNTLLFKVDYAHPFTKKLLLEIGLQSTYTFNEDDFDYTRFEETTDEWADENERSNFYRYTNSTTGVYGMLQGKIAKFQYAVGLRFENVFLNPHAVTSETSHERNLLLFLPSLNLMYKFTERKDIKLSFSRRANLPNYGQLNPYSVYYSDYHISKGNAMLSPQKINNLELMFHYRNDKLMLNTGIFYKQIDDIIGRLVEVDDEGVTITRSENISSAQNIGAELMLIYKPNDKLRSQFSATAFHNDMRGEIYQPDGRIQRNSYQLKSNTTITLFKNLRLQISGEYYSATLNYQGKTYENWVLDAALRNDFFKKRLSIVLKASDIFDSSIRKKDITNREDYYISSFTKSDTRRFMFTLTYKFAKMKF